MVPEVPDAEKFDSPVLYTLNNEKSKRATLQQYTDSE